MTATLDEILRATGPVDDAPFDLSAALASVNAGRTPEAAAAILDIARYVNSLRVDTERARQTARNLEADAANVDRRIAEALRLLERAESYSASEDCSGYIDDAMAALRGAA